MIHALDGLYATRQQPYDPDYNRSFLKEQLRQRLTINERNNLVAYLSPYYSRQALARVFDMKPDQVSQLKSERKWKTRPAPFLKIKLKPKYQRLAKRPRPKGFFLTIPQYFSYRKLYAEGELIPAHEIPFLRN